MCDHECPERLGRIWHGAALFSEGRSRLTRIRLGMHGTQRNREERARQDSNL